MSALLTDQDYLRFPQVDADLRLQYGAHPLQFAELSLPRTPPPHPVIILIHGGCYLEVFDLPPTRGMAAALRDLGYAVWNIEYRRHGCGGDFPNMFLDVAAAADYLRGIAAQHALDLARVVTVGHSAGGHLALWLAARRNIAEGSPLYRAEPLPIHGVLALAPLADIARAWHAGVCEVALPQVMGGSPEEVPEHYHAASPIELLPLGIPQRLLIGEHDHSILANIIGYMMRAASRGDDAKFWLLPKCGHFEIVSVGSRAWASVCEALAFLMPT